MLTMAKGGLGMDWLHDNAIGIAIIAYVLGMALVVHTCAVALLAISLLS